MILVEEKEGIFFKFKFSNSLTEIFDYSLKELKEINSFLEQSTFIVSKKDHAIIRVDNQSSIESKNGEKLLFHIRKNKTNANYILENPLPSKISNNNTDIFDLKLWFVLNNEKNENQQNIYKIINEDYFLHENDIIKFGNVKYIVFELHIDSKEINNNEEEYETANNENNNYDINELNKNAGPILDFYPSPKESYNSPNEKNNIICHICKKFECSEENPIIKFCNCNSFHFFCLKTEIKEKIIKKTNHKNVKSYYINGINCKNCNFIYPLKFKISEKIYDLIDIKKPSGNFLILLSIETKIYYGYMKLIHVVELNEQEITITIGRESTNDVINPDPSISRQHAIIKYNQKNGKVLLKNLSKKYGTLVLIKKSLKLNENKIQLQIGKIFFEAQIMKFGEFEKLKNKNTKNPLPKKD